MHVVENVMKLELQSDIVKIGFLKIYFPQCIFKSFHIFTTHIFLLSKLIPRTLNYGQVSHYQGSVLLLKKNTERKRSQKGRHKEIMFYCRPDTLVCFC